MMVGSGERKAGESSSAGRADRAADAVPVLCIGAIGQSGSTLLARMLGAIPGFVTVGETGRIWDKGLLEDMACGCGEPFRSCPFWSAVGEEAFGGWGRVDAAEATRLRDRLTLRGKAPHPFALPLVLRPGLSRTFGADLARYEELMRRLYRGIHAASGGRTVVDSMKQPAHVYMVGRLAGVDPVVIHLVRDSRGVADSKTRFVHRQGARADEFRVRRKPPEASEKWMWMNLAFEALPRLGVRTSRVRYEDLVRRPREELRRVLGELGRSVGDDDLGFVRADGVELSADHFAAGSRMRMEVGRIALVADEAWRRSLSDRDRRLVTAISYPLLRRYGYADGGTR